MRFIRGDCSRRTESTSDSLTVGTVAGVSRSRLPPPPSHGRRDCTAGIHLTRPDRSRSLAREPFDPPSHPAKSTLFTATCTDAASVGLRTLQVQDPSGLRNRSRWPTRPRLCGDLRDGCNAPNADMVQNRSPPLGQGMKSWLNRLESGRNTGRERNKVGGYDLRVSSTRPPRP